VKDNETEAARFMRSKVFRASYQGISRRGRHVVDKHEYDAADWALLPPPTSSVEEKQATLTLAHGYAKIAHTRGGAAEAEAVKTMMEIREDLYMNWVGQYMYFYMGAPRYRPLPVMLGIWQMTGERDEELQMLAGYGTRDLVEPPVLEDFYTEHLGTGVKVWCVQKAEKRRKAVVGLLGYAWRCPELETDLHLKTMCTDLGWLQGAMPGIEEFARAIRIVPKSDGD
jgi:hypothetical protein